jgi:hypothetical protein
MAYEFQKLSEVEALAEVPEGANALIEVNGDIKRVPGSGLGGGGIKTAIIKSSDYDNTVAGLQTMMSDAPPITYECVNMTFEEAYETMANGEPLSVFCMLVASSSPLNLYGFNAFAGTVLGIPMISIGFTITTDMNGSLFWTADGISTELPEQPR